VRGKKCFRNVPYLTDGTQCLDCFDDHVENGGVEDRRWVSKEIAGTLKRWQKCELCDRDAVRDNLCRSCFKTEAGFFARALAVLFP